MNLNERHMKKILLTLAAGLTILSSGDISALGSNCIQSTPDNNYSRINEEDIYKQAKSAYDAGDYGFALELLRPAADRGFAKAQNLLGNCYFNGHGVKQDLELSTLWYRRSAEQGYANAQYNLGNAYRFGNGVKQDDTQALYWYEKAAEQDFTPAIFQLGCLYDFNLEDYAKAAGYYHEAAQKGESFALVNLGVLYERGFGVPQDYDMAFVLYNDAAQKGNAYGCYNLGLCHQFGRGTEVDIIKAVEMYKKAVDAGYPDTTVYFRIGQLLFSLDDGECYEWLVKSADSGDLFARIGIGACIAKGLGTERDIDKAVEIFKAAIEYDAAETETDEECLEAEEYSSLGSLHLSNLYYKNFYTGIGRQEAIDLFWNGQYSIEAHGTSHWFLSDDDYEAIFNDWSKSAFFKPIGSISYEITVGGYTESEPDIPEILWPENDIRHVTIVDGQEVPVAGINFALADGHLLFAQYGYGQYLCETGIFRTLEEIVPGENFDPDPYPWVDEDDPQVRIEQDKGFLFRLKRGESDPGVYCRIHVDKIHRNRDGSIAGVELSYQVSRFK